MTVKLEDGTTLKIWFKYEERTTKIVCEGIDGQYETKVKAHPSDLFVKAKGRRVALTNFLKTGGMCQHAPGWWRGGTPFTREERRAVWAAYFEQHSDLRRKSSKLDAKGTA